MEALFFRVLTLSITCGAVVGLALLLLPKLKQRYAAKTAYILWLVLALRLVTPFEFALPQSTAVTLTPPETVIELSADRTVRPATQTGTTIVPGEPISQAGTQAPLPTAPVSSQLPTQTAPAGDEESPTLSVSRIAAILWLVGCAVVLLWQAGGYLLARRTLMKWAEPADEEELALLKQLAGEKHPALYRAPVDTPMMLGLFRPVLLLPLEPLDKEDLTIALCHEQAHWKRHDVAYKTLMAAACVIHWFNPLVWLMAKQAGQTVEICCDDAVTAGQGEDFCQAYGRALIHTAAVERAIPFTTCFGGGKEQMKERLQNLFVKKKNGPAAVCLFLCAALLMGGLISCGEGKANVYRGTLYPYELKLPDSLVKAGYTVESTQNRDTFFHTFEDGSKAELFSVFAWNTADLEAQYGSGEAFAMLRSTLTYLGEKDGMSFFLEGAPAYISNLDQNREQAYIRVLGDVWSMDQGDFSFTSGKMPQMFFGYLTELGENTVTVQPAEYIYSGSERWEHLILPEEWMEQDWVVLQTDDVPAVWELDPETVFCQVRDPLDKEVQLTYKEFREQVGPANRIIHPLTGKITHSDTVYVFVEKDGKLLSIKEGNDAERKLSMPSLTVPGGEVLYAFFTDGSGLRLSTFDQGLSSGDAARVQAATEQYYADLAPLCTEDCLTRIQRDRTMYNYDVIVRDSGCRVVPAAVKLSQPNEGGARDFTVTLHITYPDKTTAQTEQKGQIIVDENGLVSSLWLAGFEGLLEVLGMEEDLQYPIYTQYYGHIVAVNEESISVLPVEWKEGDDGALIFSRQPDVLPVEAPISLNVMKKVRAEPIVRETGEMRDMSYAEFCDLIAMRQGFSSTLAFHPITGERAATSGSVFRFINENGRIITIEETGEYLSLSGLELAHPVTYTNDTYGFSLNLPAYWADKYTATEMVSSDGIIRSIEFKQKNHGEAQGRFFDLVFEDKEEFWADWSKDMTYEEIEQAYPVPMKMLGTGEGKVFYLQYVSDEQADKGNAEIWEEYETMEIGAKCLGPEDFYFYGTGASLQGNTFVNLTYDFSIDLPESWAGNVGVRMDSGDEGADFYFLELGDLGYIFDILVETEEREYLLGRDVFLGHGNGVWVYGYLGMTGPMSQVDEETRELFYVLEGDRGEIGPEDVTFF